LPEPTKRALEASEVGTKLPIGQDKEVKTTVIIKKEESKPEKKATRITEIVSFATGEITVKMDDGKTYRREGGTIAWRYNNPGNLKFGQFAKQHGALGEGAGGHSVFPTKEIGTKAQKELLFRDGGAYYNKSITNAIARYAPSSDGNNPKAYAAYIAAKVGVPVSKVLKDMTDEQKDKMVEAMQIYEGYKEGAITLLA